jgi:hypothetical protein
MGDAARHVPQPWLIASLLGLCFLAFAPVFFLGFVDLDDGHYVTANPLLGLSGEAFWRALFANQQGNWLPLTLASHLFDIRLFGFQPAWHHVHNLLYHLLNSWLVYRLFCVFLPCRYAAWFVTLLWAIHPLNVESVAWVSERKNLLSTTFFLFALHFWHSWKTSRGRGKYWACLLAFALGLASKSMVVTLPFVLMLLHFGPYRTGRGCKADLRELLRGIPSLIPFLFLSLAFSLLTLRFQQTTGAASGSAWLTLGERLLNAGRSYGVYLKQFFLPFGLSLQYPMPRQLTISEVWPFLLLVVGTGAVLLWFSRKNAMLLTGFFFFLGTLVPVIGIVQVGAQAHADRYMYLPMLGLCLILGQVPLSWLNAKVPFLLACAFFLLLCLRTGDQVRVWRSTYSLWTAAFQANPDNVWASTALVDNAIARKDWPAAQLYAESIARTYPGTPFASAFQARVWRNQGFLARASALLQPFRQEEGTFEHVHLNYEWAWICLAEGRLDEAVRAVDACLAFDASVLPYHRLAATIYGKKGDFAKAETHWTKVLQEEPSFDNLLAASEFYGQFGRSQQADALRLRAATFLKGE